MSTMAAISYRTVSADRCSTCSILEQSTAGKRQKTWRLTRRGRFVLRGLPLLTLVALIVLGAAVLANPGQAQAGNSAQSYPATELVTVRSGQSLWDIASETAPAEDIRDVVNEIMELNELSSVSIIVGQQLEVPVYTQK